MNTVEKHADKVLIIASCRTPMGGFQGALSSVTAPVLGATAISEVLRRAGIEGERTALVDEVIMGCVLPAGLGQGPARQAMRGAGLLDSTGATTINKLCGSGMKAVMQGCDAILAGSSSLVMAGGMESMSNAPYLLEKARTGYRMGHGKVLDHMFLDGLEDAETGRLMGSFAQDVAERYGLGREDMDAYAIESLRRANAAIDAGDLDAEIVSVTVSARSGESIVKVDEQPQTARPDKIPNLKPAFSKDGTITAANASSISDGASALLLASEAAAAEHSLEPVAQVIGYTTHSQAPGEFTLAPIGAMQKLFEITGWKAADVDLFEINEAFAMVTMLAIKELGLDPAKVNASGGACAQGHPIGSTGSRLIVTLIHALQRTGKRRGVASLCIGGGEATAIAIELL